MKKMKFTLATSIIIGVIITSCATTGTTVKTSDVGKKGNGTNVIVEGKKTKIVDWDGMTLLTDPIPAWLTPAKENDYSVYKKTYKISDNIVCRNSVGTGADVRSATMRADMAYSRKIASELKQSINAFAAEQARAGNITDKTREAIENVTKVQSDVEITGHQKAIDFWQQVIQEDPLSGEQTSCYIVYQIYQIDAKTWSLTTAKYVKEVLGKIDEELSPEQDFVKGLVAQMMEDARYPTILSQEEAKAKAEANKKMADVQESLAPAQQKAAAEQALLQIMQDGKTERTKIIAESKTAQTEALADATKTAYLSGNPVYQSAATITADDQDWVEAEALAASILFN